jgi:hypothetical protein
MINSLDKKRRENQDKHFMFNILFSLRLYVYETVEKCCRAGEATDDIITTTHVRCMLDN